MNLTDLEPRWIYKNKVFAFRCPHCRKTWLTCKRSVMSSKEQRGIIGRAFGEDEQHNVVACKPDTAWKMSDFDFATMTIKPSIDASASGHWHGHVTGGRIT